MIEQILAAIALDGVEFPAFDALFRAVLETLGPVDARRAIAARSQRLDEILTAAVDAVQATDDGPGRVA